MAGPVLSFLWQRCGDCERTSEGPLNLAQECGRSSDVFMSVSQFATQYIFPTSLWLDTVARACVFFISSLCPLQMTHLYSNVGGTAPGSSPLQLCLVSSLTLAPSQPRPPLILLHPRGSSIFFSSLLSPGFLPPLFFFFFPTGALYLISKEC